MPTVYLTVNGFAKDNLSVNITVYPRNCEVSIVVGNYETNKHEEYNFQLSGGVRSVALKSKLESGDYIDISAECEGWKKADYLKKLR